MKILNEDLSQQKNTEINDMFAKLANTEIITALTHNPLQKKIKLDESQHEIPRKQPASSDHSRKL